MQHCIQFFGPMHREDTGPVRGDPEEDMKKVTGLGHLSYADRLRELGLFSLENRKLQEDLTVYASILKF